MCDDVFELETIFDLILERPICFLDVVTSARLIDLMSMTFCKCVMTSLDQRIQDCNFD